MSQIDLFLEFWSLKNPNVVWVLCGAMLLGAGAGVIGCFTFLRKRSLTGDALAHAALPGVTTAFLLFHSRDPWIIFSGAVVSCFIGYFVIEYLIQYTRIKEDSAFAIVLSLFFSLGVFQLTLIQRMGIASQSGLDKLLFGQAASLVSSDVQILGTVAGLLLLFVAVFFRELKAISFDRQYAICLGLPVRFYEGCLALAIVLSVVIGLQLVGVVLMAAILLTPAAAARYWSNDLRFIILIAGIFGALSGMIGANVSYLAPRMPTGPWMVVGVTLFFVCSLLFAPRRGLLGRVRRQMLLSRKINEENVLRTMYKINETSTGSTAIDTGTIMNYRNMHINDVESALDRLKSKGLVEVNRGKLFLTTAGNLRAEEVTRFHRLWELYLSKQNIAHDHVHDEAEDIEHIMTPELAEKLLAELDSPAVDPHGKAIPLPVLGDKDGA